MSNGLRLMPIARKKGRETMWETIAPPLLGVGVYCLVTWIAKAIADGLTGGISEDESEDEKIN